MYECYNDLRKEKTNQAKTEKGQSKENVLCISFLFAWRHKQRCDCTTWFHNSETTVNPRQNLAGCSNIAPVSGCHRLSFFCAEMLPSSYVTIHLKDFRNMWSKEWFGSVLESPEMKSRESIFNFIFMNFSQQTAGWKLCLSLLELAVPSCM